MTNEQDMVLLLLKKSLFPDSEQGGTNSDLIDNCEQVNRNAVFYEVQQQAVVGVTAEQAVSFPLISDELKERWRKASLSQVTFYCQLLYCQNNLIQLLRNNKIPMAILKGCGAAMYYPKPENRAMGDVDFLVKTEDFDKAYCLMLEDGYVLARDEDNVDYHYTLEKNGILFELHRWPAGMKEGDKYLNELFQQGLDNIEEITLDGYKIPILPKLQNGLVLMLHIVKHLRSGLGFRQIIDWMMYVDKCLDDRAWVEYESIYIKAGLKPLAVTVTKMCQIYFGLSEDITWCREGENDLCRELMEYVILKGNFGHKENSEEAKTVNTLVRSGGIIAKVKDLQKSGCRNWNLSKKYPALRVFAWGYQLFRYASHMIKNPSMLINLKGDIEESNRRMKMFTRLGQ